MKRYLALILGAFLLPLIALHGEVGSILRKQPSLNKILPADAKIEKLRGDFRFTEGPVWVRGGSYL